MEEEQRGEIGGAEKRWKKTRTGSSRYDRRGRGGREPRGGGD